MTGDGSPNGEGFEHGPRGIPFRPSRGVERANGGRAGRGRGGAPAARRPGRDSAGRGGACGTLGQTVASGGGEARGGGRGGTLTS